MDTIVDGEGKTQAYLIEKDFNLMALSRKKTSEHSPKSLPILQPIQKLLAPKTFFLLLTHSRG